MNKKKVGGKKSWNQKIEDFLEIPVWICGEEDLVGGMGSMCKRRGVSVYMEYCFFFPLAWRNPNSKTSSEIWRRLFKLVLSKQ